jgi:DNA-binding NtrC family response regulator
MNAHKKVMFVDDEEGVRLSWNRYLTEHGFDVTTAEDGAKAISKLRTEDVDVVVSDLKMPGVDGIQLLEWIHAKRPETRFILLTGFGNEEVERTVRQLGAFDYLNKPISPETLAAVVTAASHLKLLHTEGAPVSEKAVMEFDTPPAASLALDAARAETPAAEAVDAEEQEVRKSGLRRTGEIVGGLIAAPILGLAFVVFLPVIGFGALFWMLGQSLWNRFKPAEV